MAEETTLAIDCGGGGIKASVLDARGTMIAPPTRTPTPYPLPPTLLVDTVVDLASQLPAATRVTMGMPGMIRHGVVTRHTSTGSGAPRSRRRPVDGRAEDAELTRAGGGDFGGCNPAFC